MDLLPLISVNHSNNDVEPGLRSAFQTTLIGRTFSRDIAENLSRGIQNSDKKNENIIYESALETLQTYRQCQQQLEIIKKADTDLLEQYGNYLIKRDKIDASFELRESIKLKHCDLFAQLNEIYVKKFNLIQKCDMLPDIIRRFLDFRFNRNIPCHSDKKVTGQKKSLTNDLEKENNGKPLDLAANHRENVLQKKKNEQMKPDFENENKNYHTSCIGKDARKKKTDQKDVNMKTPKKQFIKIEPSSILFENCERGKVYKKLAKIYNVGAAIQRVVFHKLPKLSCFRVDLNSNTKIAPGMSVTVVISYKSDIYNNQSDSVVFVSDHGSPIYLHLKSFREPPRLFSCILKSNMKMFDIPTTESQNLYEERRLALSSTQDLYEERRLALNSTQDLYEERQLALNSTIDCGGCFLGEYVLLTIIFQNRGNRGSFFIISEQDWFLQDIGSISSSLEMFTRDFWIYPTYFEIDTGELAEINIIFQPSIIGTQMENCYIICDNNALNQIELIGDAWYFSKSFVTIDIPPQDTEIENKEDYIVYLGHVNNNSSEKLVITVRNNSASYLACEWMFENKPVNDKIYNINCVKQKNSSKELAPYSTVDFEFEILFSGTVSGYYSIFFGFYILNIPEVSLNENEEFIVCDYGNGFEYEEYEEIKTVDIQITEFEVAAYIYITPEKEEILSLEPTPPPSRPRLDFSSNLITFGILPPGVICEKPFGVVNLTDEHIEWFITEIKYNVDRPPHLECSCSGNISHYSGQLEYKLHTEKLSYKISTKIPQQWVSILILSSNIEPQKIEAICIVTYDVEYYDIAVNTGYSENGILCPLQVMYVGIPHEIKFSIENRSHITGGFFLLQPYGKDSDKIIAEFDIQSAVLNPAESVDITVTVTCSEIGIFESFFVPCFIGMFQEPIHLRVLCVVDGLQIYYYLPIDENKFKRILWPPRIIADYEYPCICEHQSRSNLEISDGFVLSDNLNITEKSISDTISSETASTAESYDGKINLRHMLDEQFSGQLITHEYVVEIHEIPLKVPTKVSLYIENITPLKTNFTVEVQNFIPNATVNGQSLFISPFTKKEEIWNNLVNPKYGILIQPETERGDIQSHEAIKINLWIFANTYGVYMDEIIVDVESTPFFGFSLIINVVGCPISFPMALNSTTGYPIMRLGQLRYGRDSFIKRVKIVNNSCIPITIIWTSFLRILPDVIEEEGNYPSLSPFFEMADEKWFGQIGRIGITNEYMGINIHGFCQVLPNEISIAENSTKFIDLEIDPKYFEPQQEQTELICTLLGRIFLEEEYRIKPNYFFRPDLDFLKMEVYATMTQPMLALDMASSVNEIKVFANDVICKNVEQTYVRLLFQNRYSMPNDVTVVLEEPLYIKDERDVLCQKRQYHIKAQGCLELIVSCIIDHPYILELAKSVYCTESCEFIGQIEIDKSKKILKMHKQCIIMEAEKITKAFPIEITIIFPNICVKPATVNFHNVLIGNTVKSCITLFNLTGCEVRFEIYKSSTADNFHINPHFGLIEKSTGQNNSFVNIFIYFTPKECEAYKEAVKIVTSVPLCFIEVGLKGTGFLNEKLRKVYKI